MGGFIGALLGFYHKKDAVARKTVRMFSNFTKSFETTEHTMRCAVAGASITHRKIVAWIKFLMVKAVSFIYSGVLNLYADTSSIDND